MLSLPQDLADAAKLATEQLSLCLGQSWLPALQAEFMPASVWTFWSRQGIGVYAKLQDLDIYNAANGENQRSWESGDVLELFFRPLPGEAYWELQVTPENHHLQLRYPSEAFFRQRQQRPPSDWLEGIALPPHSFSASTQMDATEHVWQVYAIVPFTLFGLAGPPAPGQEWLASFGRYDYTRGRSTPILSTSATPTRADFHEQHSWRVLQFMGNESTENLS